MFLLLSSFVAVSQDIVYDPLIGNKEYWRRIKVGEDEKILNTYFQNEGYITKSKILMGAGIWDGLVENIDYELVPLNYDTILFEFKSDEPLNLNFYRYYYNENYSYNFIGLRKAQSGDDMFTGQYLFVCPIPPESQVIIYTGIGTNKKEYLRMNGTEIVQYINTDYDVPNVMTVKVINGQRRLMRVLTKEYIVNENNYDGRIVVWPNPVNNDLHIKILDNTGLILRIYSNLPLLKYEELIEDVDNVIDISSFLPGVYILVFSDKSDISILHTVKIIKQ